MSALEKLHAMRIRRSREILIDLFHFHEIEVRVASHSEPCEWLSLVVVRFGVGLSRDNDAGNLACLAGEHPRDRGASGMAGGIYAPLVHGVAAKQRRPHRVHGAQGGFPWTVPRIFRGGDDPPESFCRVAKHLRRPRGAATGIEYQQQRPAPRRLIAGGKVERIGLCGIARAGHVLDERASRRLARLSGGQENRDKRRKSDNHLRSWNIKT